MWSDIFIIAILLVLNGFFAMSELAIVSASKPLLKQRAAKGSRRAAAAIALSENPGRFLSTVQIGITLVGIVAGAYGGATLSAPLKAQFDAIPLLAAYSDTLSVAIVVALITYFSVVMGELIPKQLALIHAETLAMFVALPMQMLARLTTPVVALLEYSAKGVMALLRIKPQDERMTETEINAVIAEGVASGAIEEEEQKVIQRVIRLGDRSVTSIMTHRSEVTALSLADDAQTALEKVAASNHSRFPVIDGDITRVVGVVTARDILRARATDFSVASIMNEILYVRDTTTCLDALQMFRAQDVGVAAVIDEYGAFEGLFTQADVLEAVVGIVKSNYDGEEDLLIVAREDGTSWLVDGLTPVDEVSMNLSIDDIAGGDYQTIAGFVLSRLKVSPATGVAFDHGGFRFEIVDMDRHRIDKILITRHVIQPPLDDRESEPA